MNCRDQVREYLVKVLRENKDDVSSLSDSDSLVLSGRLSSLDVVDILTFLEEKFGLELDPVDFDQTKFDSINSIVAMLEAAGATGKTTNSQ